MEIFADHGLAAFALPKQVSLPVTNKNKKIIKIKK